MATLTSTMAFMFGPHCGGRQNLSGKWNSWKWETNVKSIKLEMIYKYNTDKSGNTLIDGLAQI